MNIMRLLAHHPDLQELVQEEIRNLVQAWRQEEGGASPTENGEFLDALPADRVDAFTVQLYQNIWAAVSEEEIWQEDSPLARLAQDALPNANSPYGYRLVYNNNQPTLLPHSIESAVVRLIYAWYTTADYSLRDIAQTLSAMHLPTPYDIHLKRKSSLAWGDWDMTVVHRIVSSPTYTGRWTYYDSHRQKSFTTDVPAIIAQGLFEKAQACLLANSNRPQPGLKYEYLLASRVTCGACGARIQLHVNRVGETINQYYRCPTAKCVTRGFRADETDAAVWGWVQAQIQLEPVEKELQAAFQSRKEKTVADTTARLSIVADYLSEYQSQLANLAQAVLPGHFLAQALGIYQERLAQAVENLVQAQDGLQKLLKEQQQVVLNLPAAAADFSTQRWVIEHIDAQIVIYGRNAGRQIQVISQLGEKRLALPKRRAT